MLLRRLALMLAGSIVLGLPVGASAQGACPNEALREAQGSTFLSECRAYEMVSPPDKNGGDVMTNPMRTRSSANGSAVTYSSLTAFADAQGTNIATDYGATRGPTGWVTRSITPPQDPYGFALPGPRSQTMLMGELSDDLSTGVMYALRPLTAGAPNVARVPNLYLRKDILAGGAGGYQLLSNSVNALEPYFSLAGQDTYLAGASEGFRHIIFETRNDLTSEASGEEWKLYEWDEGTLRLAGVLPGGEPAAGSQAGLGANSLHYTTNMISRDGSRVFFADTTTGKIYMRENHSVTTQLNVEERSSPDPDGPEPAELWNVTPDGSRVFFTTSEELTEDDNNTSVDLYMYDVNAPAGHHLTMISRDGEPSDGEGDVGDVQGISEDGSYVYFRDKNKLVSGQPDRPSGNGDKATFLYVWHQGTVRFIGIENAFEEAAITVGDALAVQNFQAGSGIRVTSSGDLVYTTNTAQTSYDTGSTSRTCLGEEGQRHCDEVYLYDPGVGRSTCVSCDPSGANPLGDARFTFPAGVGYANAGFGPNQYRNHAITDDATKVFFDSPDPLVPRDTNGRYDVYEYDVASGHLALISSGQSAQDSFFDDASPDGHDVFFTTHQQLVSEDIDGNVDLYDARIEGGIAAQNEQPAGECVGDGCQGSVSASPSLAAPASATLAGGGNLTAPASPSPAKKSAKRKPRKPAKPKRGRKHKRAKKAHRSVKSASHRAGR